MLFCSSRPTGLHQTPSLGGAPLRPHNMLGGSRGSKLRPAGGCVKRWPGLNSWQVNFYFSITCAVFLGAVRFIFHLPLGAEISALRGTLAPLSGPWIIKLSTGRASRFRPITRVFERFSYPWNHYLWASFGASFGAGFGIGFGASWGWLCPVWTLAQKKALGWNAQENSDRHPRGSGDPASSPHLTLLGKGWIPAFAGMTRE